MSDSPAPSAAQAREPLDRAPSSAEDEHPKTWPIGTVISVPIGLLLFAGIVQLMLIIAAPTQGTDRSDMSPEQKLRERLAEDQKRLSSYGWVDPKAKATHIPIDRAMEILAKDAAHSKVRKPK